MSILTTKPLKCAPSAAAGVTLTVGNRPTWGAWVEVIAATSVPIAIAGAQFAFDAFTTASVYDLDIGVGAAASEASVGTIRLHSEGAAGFVSGPDGLLLPVAMGAIGAGVRVSVRARGTSAQGPQHVTLQYYEQLDSTQVTTAQQILCGAPDDGAATITTNGTPWANSDWVELIDSTPGPVGILGLSHGTYAISGSTGTGADGMEYDIGIGAAGGETVLTTVRDAAYGGNQRVQHTWLPGIFPVVAGVRISVRLRKAGTTTVSNYVSMLYYTNVRRRNTITLPMFTTGGTTGPLSWIELILKNG